jgi:diguanylate cyclase (GGDEF)-like protein/PAS domain S-box-containing protein
MDPRYSLRTSAIAWIGGAVLLASTVAILSAIVAYHWMLDRSAAARAAVLQSDFVEKLKNAEREWQELAIREKSRLDFSRILENPENRWDKLRTYLTLQSDSPYVFGVSICDGDGRLLFQRGPSEKCKTHVWESKSGYALDYIPDSAGNLFVELDTLVWLGPEGMGVMHQSLPLDNAFLRRQAFPGTELFIEWERRILASSGGATSAVNAVAGYAGKLERDGRRIEQVRLAMPGMPSPPHLLIQTHIEPPFSIAESIGFGVAVFCLVVGLIALALRGWSAGLLPRFEGLVAVARQYTRAGKSSPELKALLQQAIGARGDELSVVGQAVGDMVAAIDAREAARHEEEMRRRRGEERLRLVDKVLASSAQAVIITDTQARIIAVNPAFTEITGYAEEEVLGENPSKFSSGHHDEAFYDAMWDALHCNGMWSGEVWDRRKSGEVYPKWLTINAVRDPESEAVTHYVGIFSDITERKKNEARIEHLAYHDQLTGLPNRYALHVRIDQSLANARRGNQQLAVMFVDLDRFKNVNDSLGHDVGDQLLVTVAERLRSVLREADTVSRLGGDEFIIVAMALDGPEDAARVAEKVIERVGEAVDAAGYVIHTSPSIGIAMFPHDGADRTTLMRNADTAMYHAKQQGRNRYHFFTAEMDAAIGERMFLETQMRGALERGEFFLVFQPQFELASGRPVGVEALLRWRHPERGLLPPDKFIPIAEESGFIVTLGLWVLEEACRQAQTWAAAGLANLRIGVNLSLRQIRDRNLPQQVAEVLERTGMTAGLLELELTESAVMDNPELATEVFSALRALGLHLAIDDFGTGYSSLAYLRRLPKSRLKIDRSFVMDLEHDPNDAAVTQGIVALAHSLGLPTIAEGIETPAQFEMLKRFGCLEGQGYLYSPPLVAEELQTFLRSYRTAANPPAAPAEVRSVG